MIRRLAAPLAGLAGIAAMASLAPIAPVAAQGSVRLDLQAQTLFVTDDPAEIALRVSGVDDTASLLFTIYNSPVLTRDEVREHHDNPPSEGSLLANFQCSLDGDCREEATLTSGPDGTVTVTLSDELIGESLRNRDGILPFVVRLIDEDRNVLDEIATSLIVLEDQAPAAGEQHRVRLAFLSKLIAPLAIQPGGTLAVDIESLLATAESLAAYPDLAVTTEIRAETLDALAASSPSALEELLTILDGRPLLRGPWVDMDEEAWRLVGESDQVIGQYARGNDTFETIVGEPPTGIVRLDPDATPETLTLLRTAGATTVLTTDAQLSTRTLSQPATRPFQLLDSNGVAITALRTDAALHETLHHDDPELAAYRAIAELTALAEESDSDVGVLLDLDELNPAALDVLLDGVADRRSLRVTSVADVAQRELARSDGETLRGDLVSVPAPDLTELADRLEATTAGVATMARMLDPEIALIEPFVDQLQAAVSADLELAEATSYVDRIDAEIDELSSGIEIAPSDRITLTDRRTDLPLTILNGQSLPVNVEVLLTAEKIRFPDGDRLSITLAPGANPLTIPVETLASGDARVTATVVSPGGFLELGSGTVDIRSTAISGLGLVISIVALIILGVWWIRTILRVRRNRGAATVSAASDPQDPAPQDPPTEGES